MVEIETSLQKYVRTGKEVELRDLVFLKGQGN